MYMYMYVSFGNFKRIIGEFKNNRILFWEIQNRILGNVLGIIGSGLGDGNVKFSKNPI